jgi:hypothetical protein
MNDGGIKFSCYSFETKGKTWQDAKSVCEGKNSHLVIIDSQTENEFIKSAVPNENWSWWIGATNFARLSWPWVDRSPLDFHRLGSG